MNDFKAKLYKIVIVYIYYFVMDSMTGIKELSMYGIPLSFEARDLFLYQFIGLYVLTSGNCRGICVNRYNSCN